MLTDEFVLIGRKWGCIVMPTINIVNLFNFIGCFEIQGFEHFNDVANE